MASSKMYLYYILEQFSGIEGIRYIPVNGDFLLYYKDKLIGGLYNNRLLIQPMESAREYMPDAEYETPYEGGKPLLKVRNVDNGKYLAGLFETMYLEITSNENPANIVNHYQADKHL